MPFIASHVRTILPHVLPTPSPRGHASKRTAPRPCHIASGTVSKQGRARCTQS